MTYEKPEVLAQNAANGSFAAGCDGHNIYRCDTCERTA